MKRNSIIEMPEKYISPFVIVVAFKPEGPLCQSTGFNGNGGHGGFGDGGAIGGDEDDWD